MSKIKLTKGELKSQRDNLKRFKRYLPMLELKQQQLQLEVLRARAKWQEKNTIKEKLFHEIDKWIEILAEEAFDITPWLKPLELETDSTNIAGVEIPIFKKVLFKKQEYDLFATPLWIDKAISDLQELISAVEEVKVLEEALKLLEKELLVTSQRVNLFAEVKIPECEEIIRVIRIYLGDQQAAAVGRSKIAKKKIEYMVESG